jgi:hypothetical protein
VLQALHQHTLDSLARDVRSSPLGRLLRDTPVLREAMARMSLRHAVAGGAAIAAASGVPADDRHCAALARFVLQARFLARDNTDPVATVDAAYAVIEHGWNAVRPG